LDCSPEDLEWLVFDHSEPAVVKSGSEFSSFTLRMHNKHENKKIHDKAMKFANEEMDNEDDGFIYQPVVLKDLQKKSLKVELGRLELYKSSITTEKNLFVVPRGLLNFGENWNEESVLSHDVLTVLYALLSMISLEERMNILMDSTLENKYFAFQTAYSVSRMTIPDLIYHSFADSFENDGAFVFRIMNFVGANTNCLENRTLFTVVLAAIKARIELLKSIDIGLDRKGKKSVLGLLQSIYCRLIDFSHFLEDEVIIFNQTVLAMEDIVEKVDLPVRPMKHFENMISARIENNSESMYLKDHFFRPLKTFPSVPLDFDETPMVKANRLFASAPLDFDNDE